MLTLVILPIAVPLSCISITGNQSVHSWRQLCQGTRQMMGLILTDQRAKGTKNHSVPKSNLWQLWFLSFVCVFVWSSVWGWLTSWVLVRCDFLGHPEMNVRTQTLHLFELYHCQWLCWGRFSSASWSTGSHEYLLWFSLLPGHWNRLDYGNACAWSALVYQLLCNFLCF